MSPSAPILLVCGLGRCGTSLAMQILEAGGMPVTGEWPAFGASEMGHSRFDPDWLVRREGHAVKLLDPHRVRLPAGSRFEALWLDRHPREQARSQAKMMSTFFGVRPTRQDIRALEVSLRRDRKAAMSGLARACVRVLRLRFERILSEPIVAAHLVCGFAGLPADRVEAMAGAVRTRPPECRPDFAVECALLGERKT